jgi:hypothetical protein
VHTDGAAPCVAQVRFVVGLRDPLDLYFSLWSFMMSIGKEKSHLRVMCDNALTSVRKCHRTGTRVDPPTLYARRSLSQQTRDYWRCLRNVPYLTGGLYALPLLMLTAHFDGRQVLFVPMETLPRSAHDPCLTWT